MGSIQIEIFFNDSIQITSLAVFPRLNNISISYFFYHSLDSLWLENRRWSSIWFPSFFETMNRCLVLHRFIFRNIYSIIVFSSIIHSLIINQRAMHGQKTGRNPSVNFLSRMRSRKLLIQLWNNQFKTFSTIPSSFRNCRYHLSPVKFRNNVPPIRNM